MIEIATIARSEQLNIYLHKKTKLHCLLKSSIILIQIGSRFGKKNQSNLIENVFFSTFIYKISWTLSIE